MRGGVDPCRVLCRLKKTCLSGALIWRQDFQVWAVQYHYMNHGFCILNPHACGSSGFILLLVFDTRIADTKAYRIQDMVYAAWFSYKQQTWGYGGAEPTTLWNPSLGTPNDARNERLARKDGRYFLRYCYTVIDCSYSHNYHVGYRAHAYVSRSLISSCIFL